MKQILISTFLMVGLVAARFGDVEEYRRSLVMQAFEVSLGYGRPNSTHENLFKRSMKTLCDELGDEGSYQTFETSFGEFKTCIQGVLTANPKPKTKAPRENILYGCRVAPEIEKCIYTLALSSESCLPVLKRDKAEQIRDMTKSLISYGCANDAASIITFFYDQGFRCVHGKIFELHKCISDADNEGDSIENVDKPSEFEESDCKEMADVRKCLISEYESCPTKTAVKFTNGLFDIFDKYSCANVTEDLSKTTVAPIM